MESFSPSDLKAILHSKRANIYYLEYCRVLVNGGRVEYVTDEGNRSLYWNIPIANTTSVLLGTGTSITQAAMREFAKAGVMVGFCGGGGTPLYTANEIDVEVAWQLPQSEYRPTEYLQRWVSFWFDDSARLKAAKALQQARLGQIAKHWINGKQLKDAGFDVNIAALEDALSTALEGIARAVDTQQLLTEEARLSKTLYKLAVRATTYGEFARVKSGGGVDPANRFLDHGNYLAYGLAASATWVLGIPHGFAVLHGKTRRGGLVFDVADLIKDAMILPLAFVAGARGDSAQAFRTACVETLTRNEALDFMIESLKQIAEQSAQAFPKVST